jgi:RHH-type rel operon transcriptional repressor/antitoxin RelB
MALVQINISSEMKKKIDLIFEKDGLTTAMGTKMILTQIAEAGVSPFHGALFDSRFNDIPENVRINMLRSEAIEAGLIQEDGYNASDGFSDELLELLGVTAEEIKII